MSFYLTHYIPDRVPESGLKSIGFLTARKSRNSTEFFLGFDTARVLTEADLAMKLTHGALVRLDCPWKIVTSEGVWIDDRNIIWLADYEHPYSDANLRYVQKHCSLASREIVKAMRDAGLPQVSRIIHLPSSKRMTGELAVV